MKTLLRSPLFYLTVVLTIFVSWTGIGFVTAQQWHGPTQPFPNQSETAQVSQWHAPTQPFPNQGEIGIPLNSSNTPQEKTGALTLSSLCLPSEVGGAQICKQAWNQIGTAGVAGQWQRSGNDVYYTDGRVGIGTSTPAFGLHVVGGLAVMGRSAQNSSYLFLSGGIENETGYISWYKPSDRTRMAYLGSDPSNLLLMLQNGSNFNIKGGNVGIGTDMPEVPLDVMGSVRIWRPSPQIQTSYYYQKVYLQTFAADAEPRLPCDIDTETYDCGDKYYEGISETSPLVGYDLYRQGPGYPYKTLKYERKSESETVISDIPANLSVFGNITGNLGRISGFEVDVSRRLRLPLALFSTARSAAPISNSCQSTANVGQVRMFMVQQEDKRNQPTHLCVCSRLNDGSFTWLSLQLFKSSKNDIYQIPERCDTAIREDVLE